MLAEAMMCEVLTDHKTTLRVCSILTAAETSSSANILHGKYITKIISDCTFLQLACLCLQINQPNKSL